MPSAMGGSWKLPLSRRGSVRTTGVVEGGIRRDHGQDVLRRRDVDAPVGTHLRVRRVLVVPEHDGAVRGRHDEEPHREQEQQGGGEPGSRRASDPSPREVPGQAPRSADPGVESSEHEKQEPEREERSAEQQEGRGDEDQRVDLTGPRLRRRPGPQLEEREHAERQDEQLHRHPREERTVLPGRGPPFLEDRPRHVRDRESEEDHATDDGGDEPEQLGGGVQADGEAHPREIGSVRGARERRQTHPQEQAERERDDRSEDRLDALGGEQHTPAEPPAVQDRQLEPLPGERECADAGQHGERDGADLEDHEQDRHGRGRRPAAGRCPRACRVPVIRLDRAQALLVLQAREDALELVRHL